MSQLRSLLETEKAAIEAFVALLREEQEALIAGQADVLETIGSRKLELVEQLNAIEARRQAMNGRSTSQAMQAWLQGQPEEHYSLALWNGIIDLARTAKALHATNGELVAMHLAKTAEAIDVLTQRQKEATLYGANGQAASGSGSRIVDSA